VKKYFQLQIKMLNRRFKDAGLEPLFVYLILTIAFVIFSIYLFYKTTFAPYIYLFLSLTFTAKFSEIKRNEFLKTIFSTGEFRKIRIAENLATAAPFIIFLLYEKFLIFSSLLFIFSILLAVTGFKTTVNITIPTPFYKKPFEFTVGFRSTFYIFPVIYLLTLISVFVNNFNLGIFSMLFLFSITLTYYIKPENEYFIWSYNVNTKQFLFEKIKTALLYSSLLVAPIVFILGIGFYENILYLLLFLLIGYAFLICIVVAKYAAYPNEIGLAQGIPIAFCIYFPPILILVIPFFFLQSKSKLQKLLQ
jgi:hypothetical protein